MRWHYRDPLLLWLLPASYAAHILEEWFGGFPEWMANVLGAPVPRPAFILINAVAMGLAILATRAATRREAHGWMAVGMATVFFVNGVAHAGSTLAFGDYSPGLVTSVVLYLPLGGLALARAWSQAGDGAFARGVLAGLAIHGAVMVIAFASADGEIGQYPHRTTNPSLLAAAARRASQVTISSVGGRRSESR